MSVIIQMWKRLAPSRTKKLSTSWVMILRLTGRGKVAHCGLCFLKFFKTILFFSESLNLMFDYITFRVKRALLQFLCNFIPFQNLRVKARNSLYAQFLEDRVILLNEVDNPLAPKVLTQINAYDNEYFINENSKIAQSGGGGDIIIISLALTVAILNLTKIPKIPNPRSILGLSFAFATKPLL